MFIAMSRRGSKAMTISTKAGRLPVVVATFFGIGFSPVAPGT